VGDIPQQKQQVQESLSCIARITSAALCRLGSVLERQAVLIEEEVEQAHGQDTVVVTFCLYIVTNDDILPE
jgi:hypothetical protein